MSFKRFFKPTNEFNQYQILDLILTNNKITQRELASVLGVAVSTINNFISEFEKDGLVVIKYHTSKTVEYNLTSKGEKRRMLLNIGYLKASQMLYNQSKRDIKIYLDKFLKDGFTNIVLYGAGEVCEILMQTIKTEYEDKINVISIIDDDINKQGKYLVDKEIVGADKINELTFDAILISSYTNYNVIHKKLIALGHSNKEILYIFK